MEFRDQQAIYEQVADHVCEMILKSEWREGERIPSVREMAMDMEVNPNTVNKGYAFVQDRGLIYNQRGLGYFVADGARERTLELKREAFFRDELPRVFRSMKLLDIDGEEIVSRWTQYNEKESTP